MEELAAAVEHYTSVIPSYADRPHGLAYGPPADPAAAAQAVEEARRAIAPLELPPDIVWLWTTWEAEAIGQTLPHPGLSSPTRMNLTDLWLQAVSDQRPRALFPIAYRDQSMLFVELGSEPGAGTIWVGDLVDGQVRRVAPSLAAWLRAHATGDREDWQERPAEALRRAAADLAAAGLEPLVVDTEDRSAWPLVWLASEVVEWDSLLEQGPTHTVAELVARSGPGVVLTATLQGRWRNRVGTAGVTRGLLTDATGTIALAKPHDVPVGGQPGMDREVEVDVEVWGPAGDDLAGSHLPVIQRMVFRHL